MFGLSKSKLKVIFSKKTSRAGVSTGKSVFNIAGGREGGQAILNELKIANFPKLLTSSQRGIRIRNICGHIMYALLPRIQKCPEFPNITNKELVRNSLNKTPLVKCPEWYNLRN